MPAAFLARLGSFGGKGAVLDSKVSCPKIQIAGLQSSICAPAPHLLYSGYDQQVRSALKRGHWQIACILVREAHELGYKVSTNTHELLCLKLADRAPWQTALATFKAAQQRVSGLEARPCASAVLGACLLGSSTSFNDQLWIQCNHLFVAAHGSWPQMLYILHLLRSTAPFALGGNDATVAMNMTLAACGKAREWKRALLLVPGMRRLQVQPSVATLGTVLAACERAGQWLAAIQLLLGPGRKGWGVLPNVVCYNSTIAACHRARQWKQALHLLWDAQQQSLRPDSITLATALRAVSSLKGHEWSGRLEELLSDMKLSRIAAGLGRLGLLGHTEGFTLLSHVSWTRALGTLQEFISSPEVSLHASALAPSEFMNSALTVLRRSQRWAEALHIVTTLGRHRPLRRNSFGDALGLLEVAAALEACMQVSKLAAILPSLIKCGPLQLECKTSSVHTSIACSASDVLLSSGLMPRVQLAMEFRIGRPLLHHFRSLVFSRPTARPAPTVTASSNVKFSFTEDVATAGLTISRELLEHLQCRQTFLCQKLLVLFCAVRALPPGDTVVT